MLLGDPMGTLQFIVENNPTDIAEKLRSTTNQVVSNEQDMVDSLLRILEKGDRDTFVRVLSVPVDLTNMDSDSAAVLAEVYRTQQRMNADRTGMKSAQGTEVDWTDVFRGIAAGLSVALAPDAPPTTTGSGTGAAPPPAPPKKDNTMLWVLGAIAVVALIVVVAVVAKKKKG